MAIKIVLFTFLFVATVSGSGCCRGFKILQFRRANILPMYEPPSPCENIYDDSDHFCENSLYSGEPVTKYGAPIPRFYSSYIDPKTIGHKCVCSKSMAPQRLMPNIPRSYYKRNYCSDPVMEDLGLRSGASCGQYGCGQFNECGPYNQCSQCPSYSHCGVHPSVFRPPGHRVLPLTLPASCVC